jgi:hypothetical protein
MPASVDKELDRLYGLPPGEFIQARKELVKAYRKAGDRESAAVVGSARRPTLAAWAVNQLVRQEKASVRALLNAGKRLRTAQRRALGGRSGAALREASDAEGAATEPLLQAARRILAQNGGEASESTLQQVERTLHAAAHDEYMGNALRKGRLTRELDPTGFGAFSPSDLKRPAKSKHQPPRTAREQRDNERRVQLRRRVQELRRAVKAAERELTNAERTLGARKRDLEALNRRLTEAERGAVRR